VGVQIQKNVTQVHVELIGEKGELILGFGGEICGKEVTWKT
jgi:hypothetical protein